MRAEYHVEVTEFALTKLGFVHPKNIRLISDLAESPDNVMKVSKAEDMLTPTSSSQVSYNPKKPRPLSTNDEKALIQGLLHTKLAYRIFRIEQIGKIPDDVYVRLMYALHGQQQVRAICGMIENVLTKNIMRPVTIPRLLGNFSHFWMDSRTPVHTYAWSRYLLGEDTEASELMKRIGQEVDQHDPYEKAAWENRKKPDSRFWQDANDLASEFARLAKIPLVKTALKEPAGFITGIVANQLAPIKAVMSILPDAIRPMDFREQ